MKELLQQYAAYNVWANKAMFDRMNKLPEEKIMQEIPGSFPSLYLTVKHMWRAEELWWQRLKLVENPVAQSDQFKGSFAELCSQLARQNAVWKEWVDQAGLNQLAHVFAFVREKEQYKMLVHDMLLHLFNHGTYHRGQLVSMLRQLGEEKIPATDFVVYCRQRK
ncbi:MAG: DinB family protein [Ferruginibacter sp.]